RTAKLWDLQTGSEVRTLGVHPNNVHAVRFIPNSHLAISVSMYQVRVWDLRTQECLRVLQSSGQVNDGDGGPAGSRQNTVPFLETVVNAAEVDPSGRLLFTSFGGDVRIWNLEKWASFGRLIGAVNSPRSEVSCLAVSEGPDGLPQVFTGSRDHYVKMFQTSVGGEGVYEAMVDFTPPHYDNVTCVVPFGGYVLSASKDKNIMKFTLTDYKRDHLELNAHNSFIQGMCLVGGHTDRPLLCSVCKEGTMKFWDITTSRRFKIVEEMPKAHSEAINSVCSNRYMVFTASR
ncbi:WD domain, G-beta repeat protein, partial [Ancylostoma duodenale]